jgi:excisionase family DNA binding protein
MQFTSPDAPRLLSIEEVAARLSLHPETVRLFLRKGKINGVKIGRGWRVTPDALADFIKRLAKSSEVKPKTK